MQDAMTPDAPLPPRILLVSPNVSRFMGGEASKALHILEGYKAMGFDVTQVAHARVRQEMSEYRPDLDIAYAEDGPLQVFLWKRGLYWPLMIVQSWLLHRKARRIVKARKPVIVHFTSPVSPTIPYFRIRASVVIGPLNGNLLHPPALAHREPAAKSIGKKLLASAQLFNRFLFRGKQGARLFVSGGERTVEALEMGGCTRSQIVHTLDSGVATELCKLGRIVHEDVNWRFVFLGRLVRYKACDLAIRALALVPQARLDVIGDGAERPALEALGRELGVADRVNFMGYTADRQALFTQLRAYRAFVFPTLAEANGIVIQEAMMLGLPIVTVKWGGPVELLDEASGIMIEPESEEAIVKGVADAMTRLATDHAYAEALSRAARERGDRLGFNWDTLLRIWLGHYDAFLVQKGGRPIFGPWLGARAAEAERSG
jgi:glycosyltransferase involved in cell wall biosynthesis